MKTNLLPEALRRLPGLLLAACLLALAGCGPGTGGTGTGPESTFAVGPSAMPGSTGPGTGTLRSDCGSECPSAVLQLDAAVVELRAQCLRFVHTGPWTAEGAYASLPGTLQVTAAGETRSGSATLQLQFTTDPAASPIVAVTLLDEAGRTVLGPQVLKRAEGGAAAPLAPCVN